MTIRKKIIALLLCAIIVLVVGISCITGLTALRFSDDQFLLNAESQLDRVEELSNSFLKTGEQVSMALSTMPECNLPPASLKSLVTTVSARVKGASGNTVGVVGVDYILADLSGILQNVKVGHSGYLLLFDGRGRIMLDPKNSDNLMKPASETGDDGLGVLASQPGGLHTIKRGTA